MTQINARNLSGALFPGLGFPVSVGAIGDSLTVRNMPYIDLYNNERQPTTAQISTAYAETRRILGQSSWLLHGALRSNLSWYVHELILGCSGATAQNIYEWVLEPYIANPYGLPRMVCVLAGTNDIPQSAYSKTRTLDYIGRIYDRLLDVGVTPIACAIPPLNNAGQVANINALNWGIARLAARKGIPFADFYSPLVSPSTGQFAQATYNTDGTHHSATAAAIMGYVLNQSIQQWLGSTTPKQSTARLDLSGLTFQSRNGNFTSHAGSINTGSSYPNVGWGVPGTVAMSTVFNAAGSESGSVNTMSPPTPNILGDSTTPNWLGNAWQITGDGVNTCATDYSTVIPEPSVGDKILLAARLKWIPDQAAVSKGDFSLNLNRPTNGARLCGIVANNDIGYTTTAQIGAETDYPAGDFFFIYTWGLSGLAPRATFELSNNAGASNAGDSLGVANFVVMNLTQAGIF